MSEPSQPMRLSLVTDTARLQLELEARKEQIKLRANYFNGLAIGLFTAGVLTPLVGAAINTEKATGEIAFLITVVVLCIGLSLVLHWQATRHLYEIGR